MTEGCTRRGYLMKSANIAVGGVLLVKLPDPRVVHTSSTSAFVGSLLPICFEIWCAEKQTCLANHPAAHPFTLPTPPYGNLIKFIGDTSYAPRIVLDGYVCSLVSCA